MLCPHFAVHCHSGESCQDAAENLPLKAHGVTRINQNAENPPLEEHRAS